MDVSKGDKVFELESAAGPGPIFKTRKEALKWAKYHGLSDFRVHAVHDWSGFKWCVSDYFLQEVLDEITSKVMALDSEKPRIGSHRYLVDTQKVGVTLDVARAFGVI